MTIICLYQQIIEHYHLNLYFKKVYGSKLDDTRNHKKDVISYCIKCKNLDYQDCIIIGNHKQDVIGTHEKISHVLVFYIDMEI